MMKFLLVALVFGLFGLARAKDISGVWYTVAIAADDREKIQEDKPLRMYIRRLQCYSKCQELDIIFQVQLKGQCTLTTVRGRDIGDGVWRDEYEGENHYKLMKQTKDFIIFYNENVDAAGWKTKMIYALGKEKALDAGQTKDIEAYSGSQRIPAQNIEYVYLTDTCP
ncbi:odorant-binding protein 1b-like [Nannospalax galili]|uniref:odorant-binding protein 1b-like n=1 Tax=Nannospalax galili TaxID=1026970 RepID=UPI00111C6143|nr:odorant-binding protein 1b-like [Nannospalax galili]